LTLLTPLKFTGRPTVLSYDADKVFKQECRINFHPEVAQHLEAFVKAYDRHLKDPKRDDQKRLLQLKDINKTLLTFWQGHVETRKNALKKHGSWNEAEILEDLEMISAHENPRNFKSDVAELKRVQDRIDAKLGVSYL
jgi:hypothetical protein